MELILISGVVGFGLAVFLFFALWMVKLRHGSPQQKIQIFSSVENLRSVGELIVFKIITKEIVTTAEHWFGEKGKRYFQWLISTKKMAMIFEFEIDFRYDLQSADFIIEDKGNSHYLLKMPQCLYEVHIRDISFYDEQNAEFLPWLLPGLLTRAFGSSFHEEEKNRLKEEAKQQAAQMAEHLVGKMRSDVQRSARKTLEALAKNFGADQVTFDFQHADLIRSKVDAIPTETVEQ